MQFYVHVHVCVEECVLVIVHVHMSTAWEVEYLIIVHYLNAFEMVIKFFIKAILLPPYVAFNSCTATVIAIRHNKQFADEIIDGQHAGVLLDKTCFYAEQGGQIYDVGFITRIGDEVGYG